MLFAISSWCIILSVPPTIHALCPIFFTRHLNTVIWVHPLQKFQSFNNACTRTKIRVHIPIQYTFHIGDYKWCMPKKDENFFSRSIFYTSVLSSVEIPVTLRSGCLPNKLFILLNEFSKQMREKFLWTKLEEKSMLNRENANVWIAFLNIE